MEKALLVFAKKPVLGKVKTRLAKDIGDEKALIIYKQLLFHTFDVAAQGDSMVMACFTEHDDLTLDSIPYDKFYQQVEGDLGIKMSEALNHAFKIGAQKTIVIGTDCPDISNELLAEAFQKLDTYDVVFGPAHDGGYYLIGMKTPKAHLFQNIAWSTENVLNQTLSKLLPNERCCQLRVLSDIDILDDLKKNKQLSAFL
jgi:uncharacterized protein